jgi:uncharacterized protein
MQRMPSSMTPMLTAGLGLKPSFYDAALATHAPGVWWEVHPENYMVDGGPRLQWLEAIRARHPVSLHSVSLSLAAPALPDAAHLARLAGLVRRVQPALVSEHLAWSAWDGSYAPDLLPVPRNSASLAQLVRNIDCVQSALGRSMAIENPSHYLRMDGPTGPSDTTHTWDEVEFLTELHRRTGCTLLLDVNNVVVSANNLGLGADGAADYIDRFPGDAVTEIHLAGHSPDPTWGQALLVDSHDTPIAAEVWALYEQLIGRIGPRPTLIERDGNVPAFDVLWAERIHAAELCAAHAKSGEPAQADAGLAV